MPLGFLREDGVAMLTSTPSDEGRGRGMLPCLGCNTSDSSMQRGLRSSSRLGQLLLLTAYKL